VNWRAIGCLGAVFGGFLIIGLIGMGLAFRDGAGCPANLQWADRLYVADGTPAPSPAFDVDGPAASIGSTFIGLTTRSMYGPPGSSPSTAAADRPRVVSMACNDGTYQTYAWDGVTRTPLPSADE
jgi:uncharacterized membrane protein YedE/YeeE